MIMFTNIKKDDRKNSRKIVEKRSKVIGIMLQHTDGDKEYYCPDFSLKDIATIYKILEKYGDENESIRGDLEVVNKDF